MRRLSGQAWRGLRLALRFLVALSLVLGVAAGWLAWRLAEGPLAVPFLARELERTVNARGGGARLEIGRAEIAWEGWRGGAAAPLDIRLAEVRVLDAGGAVRAALPDAALALSVRALLLGHLAPATIELRRPSLRLFRAEDGSLRPDLGGLDAAPAPAPAAPAAAGPDPLGLLAELMRPPSDSGSLAALRRIRVTGGEVTVVDRALGETWALLDPMVDIRRAAEGGLAAEGTATLRLGALNLPVRLTGSAQGRPMRLAVGLGLPALHPAELAAALPILRPLAVLDAPVGLSVAAEFDAAGNPQLGRARLVAEAGAIDLGPGRRIGFQGLELAAEGSGRQLRITEAALRLPGPEAGGPQGGAPGVDGRGPVVLPVPLPADPAARGLPAAGPVLSATGQAGFREGRWEATLDARLDSLLAAELPRLWPEALAPELRAAISRGLPAGRLHDARLRLALTAPESLDDLALVEARAALAAEGAVLDLGPDRRIATAAAEVAAQLTPDHLTLERLALRLPVPPRPVPGPATSIIAQGEATRRAEGWRGTLSFGLDAIAFADLAAHWPAGLASGGERAWMVENITAGQIRNGQWRIEAVAPASLDALTVTALSGTAEAVGATVHWLRPVPPATGAHGSAEFGLDEITLRLQGGRQAVAEGGRGTIELREGRIRFHGLAAGTGQAEITLHSSGGLPEHFTLLRHPRLKLFERRKLEVTATAGQVEGRLNLGFPLLNDLPIEQLRIRATARIAEARLPAALIGRDLERAGLELAVDNDSLRLSGQGLLAGLPVRLGLEMDFRAGPPSQVTERGTLSARPDARQIAEYGLETGRVLTGPVPVEARYERRRAGPAQVFLRGDLREARLALDAVGWAKPPGTPGIAEAVLQLRDEQLQAIESFRLEALELAVRGRASFAPRARLDRVDLIEGRLGGSRFQGEVRAPAREGEPWAVSLHGPLLDLRPVLGTGGPAEGGWAPEPPGRRRPPEPEGGPPLLVDARFENVLMGERRGVLGLVARAQTDARGLLREARITGRTGGAGGGFEAQLSPRGQQRLLRLVAEDGGALLRALDLVEPVQGGRLTVNAAYQELRPGAALTGTAELEQFVVRDAPAFGKILQAMTLYGLVEAVQGGSGLAFTRLVAPFALTPEALLLNDARAFSASLGLTVKGRVLRTRPVLDLEGTIIPAYAFNSLLGNIPLVGRLFSPEAGGGVFAATFRVQGPIDQPTVTMNPLAALTPGFLRGLFGFLDQPAEQRR